MVTHRPTRDGENQMFSGAAGLWYDVKKSLKSLLNPAKFLPKISPLSGWRGHRYLVFFGHNFKNWWKIAFYMSMANFCANLVQTWAMCELIIVDIYQRHEVGGPMSLYHCLVVCVVLSYWWSFNGSLIYTYSPPGRSLQCLQYKAVVITSLVVEQTALCSVQCNQYNG